MTGAEWKAVKVACAKNRRVGGAESSLWTQRNEQGWRGIDGVEV